MAAIYNPPYADRIWSIWGSYYNILKAIMGLYDQLQKDSMRRSRSGRRSSVHGCWHTNGNYRDCTDYIRIIWGLYLNTGIIRIISGLFGVYT